MLSQTTEYALRAMACMANRPAALTTGEIAQHTRVPMDYLSKVLQALNRNGLVNSRRGLGGGFSLARDPAEISLLDVINAVEPIRRITQCPLDLKAHAHGLCPLHRQLDDALAYLESTFGSQTLADLTTPSTSSFSLGLCPQSGVLRRGLPPRQES